jgi:hypothetical protein
MVWETVALYILPVRRDMMPDGYDLMERQATLLAQRAFSDACPAGAPRLTPPTANLWPDWSSE